jgi:protein required for attachment to host cells
MNAMNEKRNTWYVVADGTRGRILRLEHRRIVRVVDEGQGGSIVPRIVPALDREFAGPNLKSREILADRTGQRTPGNRGMPADPHENAKMGFALELAEVLDQACSQNRFEQLVLVAPPEMLGKIRQALSEQGQAPCRIGRG